MSTPAGAPRPSIPASVASKPGRHTAEPHPYRADIDGLRALAVLPILFNHAGLRGFGGGFVGVDIFFVISGYLITGILLRDIAAKRHSIAEFYRRRILRIFPALFAMLAVVTGLAIVALLPGELMRFARSTLGTTFFSSNFIFYSESGYFDGASHVKPLLHTWSLAIEEQFYIVWPLLLAAIGVGRPGVLRIAMGVIAAASFAVAIWLVGADPTAAFYLLPSRAWELALGGLLAGVANPVRHRALNEALALIGLALIGYAVLRFAGTTPFPGAAALLPCTGTALLILVGPATIVSRLLSLRPVTSIGLISYSLYLWHWPVIVFAEVWLLLHPSPAVMAGEIAVSLILATLSWRFIETPFRIGGRDWSTPRVLAGGALAMALAAITAGALIAAQGLPYRFTPAEQALARYKDGDYEAYFRRGTCFIIDPLATLDPACLKRSGIAPEVLLIGDSMAAHLWPGLSRYRDRLDIVQATMAGCTPGLYPGGGKKCERFFRQILTGWVPANPRALVLLAGRWQGFDMGSLDATLAALVGRGTRVIVVGPPPTYEADLPRLLVFAARNRDPGLIARSTSPISFDTDRQMRSIAARHGVPYVSLIGALCPDGACRTLAVPGVPMQFDYGHFTPQGSAVAAAAIMPRIDTTLRTAAP